MKAPVPIITAARPKVGGPDLWKVDAGGACALLVVSALAYFLGAVPLMERHARASADVTELAAAREKAAESSKLLEATRKSLAAQHADLAASPLKLQPLGQLNRRLAVVADVAAQAGASLDDVQPGRPVVGAKFDTMPVKVAGAATFTSFASLLHRLRSEMPDSGVDGFELTLTNPVGINAGASKFSFDLVWYTASSQPAKAPAAAAASDAARK